VLPARQKMRDPALPQFTTHPPAVGKTRRNFKPEAGTTFASLALGAGY
jgi:hypothetical protein